QRLSHDEAARRDQGGERDETQGQQSRQWGGRAVGVRFDHGQDGGGRAGRARSAGIELLEDRETLELAVTFVDFVLAGPYESIQAEVLDVERGHDAAENDRTSHGLLGEASRFREIADESTREG